MVSQESTQIILIFCFIMVLYLIHTIKFYSLNKYTTLFIYAITMIYSLGFNLIQYYYSWRTRRKALTTEAVLRLKLSCLFSAMFLYLVWCITSDKYEINLDTIGLSLASIYVGLRE